jgi:hypothetical protein
LYKLEEVLATGDTSWDPEPSHAVVYQRIFAACASFEKTSIFYSSESPQIGATEIGSKVPEWMHTVKEISIGGRRQVLEDGNDVCDSESDSENEDHGEVLTGCCKGILVDKDGNPLSAEHKLAQEQVAALRWGASFSNEFSGSTIQAPAAGFCKPITQPPPQKARAPTPLNSDYEEVPMTEGQKRAQASALRKAQKANTRGLPAPSRFEGAGEESQASTQMTTRSKAKGNEGDQRVSKELVPIPKKKASRAGGLRPAVGSG